MNMAKNWLSGATTIIRQCLKLKQGEFLLIIEDEETIAAAQELKKVAESLNIYTEIIHIPILLQRQIPHERQLSDSIQDTIKKAQAILTCVNPGTDCFQFRDYILEANWSARTRIGHMPGANLDILSAADVDMGQLIESCKSIEKALARGKTIKMITRTALGTQHSLMADIGGWNRLPVTSDGIIEDGVWGNVPSGETYIAPIEGTAEGSIVINGSIPGLVIEPDEELILYFEKGRIAKIEPENNTTAQHLQKTQIANAEIKGDENWACLAEIGIGANTAVTKLTGNMLLDEKAAGTAHVALGSNTFMGGSIDSTIHCDMVIKNLMVIVDNKTILDKNGLCINNLDWEENYTGISINIEKWQKIQAISQSGVQTAIEHNRLQRFSRSAPGRIAHYFVGDKETSILAGSLFQHIPKNNEWINTEDLVKKSKLDTSVVYKLLEILARYDLIKLR